MKEKNKVLAILIIYCTIILVNLYYWLQAGDVFTIHFLILIVSALLAWSMMNNIEKRAAKNANL